MKTILINIYHFFQSHIPFTLIIILGVTYSISARKLTISAAVAGSILACLIFAGSGYIGIAMMSAFFVLGSVTTSWKKHIKASFTDSIEAATGRSAMQVLANAGVAAFAAFIMLQIPESKPLMLIAMASAFASASGDTVSSELGMVMGKRFFNIKTFKPDQCGLDGVISLEGTLVGILASAGIAGIYSIGYGWGTNFFVITIAGTVGNLTDSVLGAVLERKGVIGNNTVNFINTACAAVFGSFLALII